MSNLKPSINVDCTAHMMLAGAVQILLATDWTRGEIVQMLRLLATQIENGIEPRWPSNDETQV